MDFAGAIAVVIACPLLPRVTDGGMTTARFSDVIVG
jgi:hypothetical protein